MLQALIILVLFPCFEHLRLPLGQIGPHGEIGLGKLQRRLIVRFGCQAYNLLYLN